jgi:hypothetical protein
MDNSTAASYGNNLCVREPVFSTPSGRSVAFLIPKHANLLVTGST